MNAFLGKKLATAICQHVGIDTSKTKVVGVKINSANDELATVSIEVIVGPGFLSAVDSIIEQSQK